MSYWILKNKVPVETEDMFQVNNFLSDFKNKVVKQENLADDVRVSTVFLGLDHRFGEGPPLLFETMIFGGEHDQYQTRCSTWSEAEEMHKQALKLLGKT